MQPVLCIQKKNPSDNSIWDKLEEGKYSKKKKAITLILVKYKYYFDNHMIMRKGQIPELFMNQIQQDLEIN